MYERDEYVEAALERVQGIIRGDGSQVNGLAMAAILVELRTMYDAGWKHRAECRPRDEG